MLQKHMKFSQEDYLFIYLSPCSLHPPGHVLPLHLTDRILSRTLSATRASAVKLKTALLSAVSCHFRHSCDPPPPTLHSVPSFYSPETTPLSTGEFPLHWKMVHFMWVCQFQSTGIMYIGALAWLYWNRVSFLWLKCKFLLLNGL